MKCPDCGSQFAGRKCSCGYVPGMTISDRPHVSCITAGCSEMAVVKTKHGNLCKSCDMKRANAEAKRWLSDRGLKTRDQMQVYRRSLGKVPPSKQWAEDIVRDYETGRYTHFAGYKMACEALSVPQKAMKEEAF